MCLFSVPSGHGPGFICWLLRAHSTSPCACGWITFQSRLMLMQTFLLQPWLKTSSLNCPHPPPPTVWKTDKFSSSPWISVPDPGSTSPMGDNTGLSGSLILARTWLLEAASTHFHGQKRNLLVAPGEEGHLNGAATLLNTILEDLIIPSSTSLVQNTYFLSWFLLLCYFYYHLLQTAATIPIAD